MLRKASYHSISYITLRCGLDPSAIGTPVNVVGLSPRTIGNSRTWICPKQTIFVGTLVPFGKMQLFMVVKENLLYCFDAACRENIMWNLLRRSRICDVTSSFDS